LIKNDLVIALRIFRRHKFHSSIKILGLALGMACCLVIFLFIQQELSFDRFHLKADRIFRLETAMTLPIGEKPYSIIRSDLMAPLLAECPDVENGVRVSDTNSLVSLGENRFATPSKYVDSSFFAIFTFPLLEGDPKTALREPLSAVITEELARKLLPGQNPVGRTIRVDNKSDFRVTGLMKNIPVNSHLQAELFMSYSSMKTVRGSDFSLDNNYLLLKDKGSAGRLEKFLPGFIERHAGKKTAENNRFYLRPIVSIYLQSNPIFDLGKKSQVKYSYYLGFLAFFILLLAVVNYVNLTTANAFQRMKEVGVRMVVGADRRQIIRQFLVESMLLSLLATLAAVFLAQSILPLFNALADRALSLDLAGNPGIDLGLLGIWALAGLASGIYPALLISSFRTADVVKKNTRMRLGSLNLKRILVVFQFAVCVLFIIGTTVAIRELRHLAHKDLGFSRENISIVPISPLNKSAEAFKNELLSNPAIEDISLAAVSLGIDFDWSSLVLPEGFAKDQAFKIPVFSVDGAFFRTIDVPLVAGRGFLEGKADQGRGAVINQQAAKKFGWASPLGKRIALPDDDREVEVVGVVKDFNLESLHKDIAPYVFTCATENSWNAFIRVNPGQLPHSIDVIRKTWLKFAPNDIFQIDFLDEQLSLSYKEDKRTRDILTFASVLAIAIACLGLFGLAAYSAESRTKEIGIRKICGALTASLVMLFGKEFLGDVLMANVLAWPLAYFLMRRWLENFVYRIPIGIMTFLWSAALTLLTAAATVGYFSIRASRANPVESLRYE